MTTTSDRGTILGHEATLSGRVAAQELTILGRFDGTLDVKALLRIGPDGRVKAVIHAGATEIYGTFEGEIDAGSLVFAETARAQGVFRAAHLTVREGARVEGAVNLPREAPKAGAVTAVPARPPQPAAPETATPPAAVPPAAVPPVAVPSEAAPPAAAAPEGAPPESSGREAAKPASAEPAPRAPHP